MSLEKQFQNKIKELGLKSPEDIHFLVVGDLMIDHYIVGQVNRISPEAPVPVVEIQEEYYTLGGAGNVIQNLRSINGNVNCVGIIGNDNYGKRIELYLNDLKVKHQLIKDSKRSTTRKIRIVTTDSVQLLRIDQESKLQAQFTIDRNSIETADVIIISDYAKGVINSNTIKQLNGFNKKIIIDPKPSNYHLYNDAFLITPNTKEYLEIIKNNHFIQNASNSEFILQTCGKNGMKLYDCNQKEIHNIHGKEVNVFNVSGCGDTVVATISLCIAMGLDLKLSMKISNECAGLVATKPGTTPIELEEFQKITLNVLGE